MHQHSWSMLKHLIHRKNTWKHLSQMGVKSLPQSCTTNAPSWHDTNHTLIWWHLAKPSHVCVKMVTVLSSLLLHLIFLEDQWTRWAVSPGWIKSHIYILYISISFDRSHMFTLTWRFTSHQTQRCKKSPLLGSIYPLYRCACEQIMTCWSGSTYLALCRNPQPPRFLVPA